MITYNNIISSFKNYFESHPQIHTFYSGDEWNFQTLNNIYPACIISPETCTIENGRFLYTFNIIIVDILTNDLRNSDEITSDLSLICGDIITEFEDNRDKYGFSLESPSNMNPITEKLIDNVGGWVLTINIQVPFSSYNCNNL